MSAMMWIQMLDVVGAVFGFGLVLAMLLQLRKAAPAPHREQP